MARRQRRHPPRGQHRHIGAMAHELATQIDRVARLSGSFVLRSGAMATEYFDNYRFESDPDLLRQIASGLATLVPPDGWPRVPASQAVTF